MLIFVCAGADSNGSPMHTRTSIDGSMQSDEVQLNKTIDAFENTHLQTPDQPVNGLQQNGLESVQTMQVESSTLEWDANVVPTLGPADVKTWYEGRATLVPGRPDFLVSYATLPGASAYRDREVGSLYISELAKCLHLRLEIDRVLKLVSHGVAKELQKRDVEDRLSRFQLPFHLTSGMDKLITL